MDYFINEKGFTLVEALMAILILSIGVLVVGNMQFTTMKANASANARTEAHAVALSFLEILEQTPYEDISNNLSNHIIVADDLEDGGLFKPLADIYTIDDDGSYPVVDNFGKHYNITLSVHEKTLTSNVKSTVKAINMTVAWDTPTGASLSSVSTVKYSNINLEE